MYVHQNNMNSCTCGVLKGVGFRDLGVMWMCTTLHLIHQQSTPISFTPLGILLTPKGMEETDRITRLHPTIQNTCLVYLGVSKVLTFSFKEHCSLRHINHLIFHIMLPAVWTTLIQNSTLIQNLPTCWQQRVTWRALFVIRTLAS